MLVGLARNRIPNPTSAAIGANLPAARAFITDDARGPKARSSSARTLHGALCHQAFKDHGLMLLARRDDEGHGLALPFSPEVNFGSEATTTPSQRFISRLGFWRAFPRTGCMLVGTHHRPIDTVGLPVKLALRVGLGLDGGQNPVPNAFLAPARKAARHGPAPTIPLRQVVPGRSRSKNPQDTVNNRAMVVIRMSYSWFARRQQRLQPLPLRIG